MPAEVRGDLFDDFSSDLAGADTEVVRSDGYLRPDAGQPHWRPDDAALVADFVRVLRAEA